MVDQSSAFNFFIIVVYAKCDNNLRMKLWGELFSLSKGMHDHCLIGGDFNVVLEGEEKIRGLPITEEDADDFRSCIESCDLSQIQFKGSSFTWWNGKFGDYCIF